MQKKLTVKRMAPLCRFHLRTVFMKLTIRLEGLTYFIRSFIRNYVRRVNIQYKKYCVL